MVLSTLLLRSNGDFWWSKYGGEHCGLIFILIYKCIFTTLVLIPRSSDRVKTNLDSPILGKSLPNGKLDCPQDRKFIIPAGIPGYRTAGLRERSATSLSSPQLNLSSEVLLTAFTYWLEKT